MHEGKFQAQLNIHFAMSWSSSFGPCPVVQTLSPSTYYLAKYVFVFLWTHLIGTNYNFTLTSEPNIHISIRCQLELQFIFVTNIIVYLVKMCDLRSENLQMLLIVFNFLGRIAL